MPQDPRQSSGCDWLGCMQLCLESLHHIPVGAPRSTAEFRLWLAGVHAVMFRISAPHPCWCPKIHGRVPVLAGLVQEVSAMAYSDWSIFKYFGIYEGEHFYNVRDPVSVAPSNVKMPL